MRTASKEKPCILRDTREQLPLSFDPAIFDTETVTLATGDYSARGFTETLALERKSLADLVMSCTKERDRFDDCLRRLREYEHKAIIVEATRDQVWGQTYRSMATPQSIIGSTRAFLVDYGIPTIWCGNARGAAEEIGWWVMRLWKKRKEIGKTELASVNTIESRREATLWDEGFAVGVKAGTGKGFAEDGFSTENPYNHIGVK